MTMSKRERKTAFELASEAARVAWYEGYNAAAAKHSTATGFDSREYVRIRMINPYEPIEINIMVACS